MGQLKQELLRTTLSKQNLEFEKKELLRRIEELERSLNSLKLEVGEKDKVIRAQKLQLEDSSRRAKDLFSGVS